MLRPDPAHLSSSQNSTSDAVPSQGDIDIQRELNKLEEIILASPRVPLTPRTLVNEDEVLDQLDLIRLNLPPAFREAVQVLQQRDTILAEAERYAQEIVIAAEQQAAQILDELGIVRQAEQMAQQVKTQTQKDCDALRSQTLAEIDQLRLRARQEWDTLRQQALADKQDIQAEADTYADTVLGQIENQLTQMLRVIQNGRQQLHPPAPINHPPHEAGRGQHDGEGSQHKQSKPASPRSPRSERPSRSER